MNIEEYERDYSHEHCWEQGKSPACGQKIKHFRCCICGELHPEINTILRVELSSILNSVKKAMPDIGTLAASSFSSEAQQYVEGYDKCLTDTASLLKARIKEL